MSKTCALCGKYFESTDQRQKYCNATCALNARRNQNNSRMRASRTADRRDWAIKEARYLYNLVYECGVDRMIDYIYNNYKKRRK